MTAAAFRSAAALLAAALVLPSGRAAAQARPRADNVWGDEHKHRDFAP